MAGSNPESLLVVCDAGPLIHLDELGCVTLLADFREVLVPATVADEVSKYRPDALAPTTVNFRKVTPPDHYPPNLTR